MFRQSEARWTRLRAARSKNAVSRSARDPAMPTGQPGGAADDGGVAADLKKATTPKSAKKVARLDDVVVPAASAKKAPTTTLSKVLACAKFELRDALGPGGHPFFQSSSMETSAKVRECYAKNLPKVGEEGQRKKFLDAFADQCATDPRFAVAFLSPFQLVTKENQAAPVAQDPSHALDKQDSLFRVFVQSPHLQKDLINWVLELLPTDPALARMGLSNLRWLNNIHDSEGFTRKLMECLQACDPPLQREIIHAIPEVIDDLGHKLTVEGLQKLMAEDPSFMGTILDTYSSLNMEASIVAGIRDDLLKRLDSVSSEFLPSALKFLLQTTPAKALPAVVTGIRTGVDLSHDSLNEAAGAKQPQQQQRGQSLQNKQARAMNYHRLTLEAIRTAMSFDEHVCLAFLNSISAAKEHKPLDVWILLIAHGLTKMRTKVETVVRKKVLSHDLTTGLMRRSLQKNGYILVEQFPAVLALADRAVRASEPSFVDFGVFLYTCSFDVFPDIFNRQSLISNILSHVGSTSSESECTAGLSILLKLARQPDQLKELWQFVETVLDHLANLSKSNLRKAWAMFAALIWKGEVGGALDDKVYGALCMVLRKQLTNMRDVYKRSGVIGAAAVLGQLCSTAPAAAGGSKDAGSKKSLSHQMLPRVNDEAAKEFEMHLATLFGLPEPLYLALALDELAYVLQEPQTDLCNIKLVDKIMSRATTLLEDFVASCGPKSDIVELAEVTGNLNLDDVTAAVNFWGLTQPKTRDQLVCLCPVLHLLQTASRKVKPDSLFEMCGLIGAPVLVCPPNYFETFEDLSEAEQTRVTLSVFHCINWMLEVLNTFHDQQDPILRARLLQRLTHIHDWEEKLEKCLRLRPIALPSVRDPTAALCAASAAAGAEPSKKKAKSAASAGKKKKGDDEGGDAAAVDTGADLPRVRAIASSFRSLKLPVFGMLNYVSSSNETLCCWLRPFALHALLRSLEEYCVVLFDSAQKRANPFGRIKSKDGAVELGAFRDTKTALSKVIAGIIPALSENLMRLGGFIAQWSASEGTHWAASSGEDAPPFDHDAAASASAERARHEFWWYIMPSQRMLFDIFGRIFVWFNAHSKSASEEEAKAFDVQMRTILSQICGRNNAMSLESARCSGGALAEVKKEAWSDLSALNDEIESLQTAVSFAGMLEALAMYGVGRKFALPSHASTPVGSQVASDVLVASSEKAYLNELSKFCLGFLRRAWPASSGGIKAADVKTLLDKAIVHSTHTSKALRPIVAALQVATDTAREEGGDVGLNADFGTLSKTTLSVFYKTTFLAVGKLLKQMAMEKNIIQSSEEKLAKLTACERLNRAVKLLIEMVKGAKCTTQVKASALREGKAYFELIQRAMPFFGHMAATESKKTIECLKEIEDGSRVLQRLCNQAKEEGAVTLLPLIPATKKCIEKLVIETCRIVDSAGLSGALRFGPLKHKNLRGDVMSSQVSYRGADVDEGDEEEEGEEEDGGGVAPMQQSDNEREGAKKQRKSKVPPKDKGEEGDEPEQEQEQEEDEEEPNDDEEPNSD